MNILTFDIEDWYCHDNISRDLEWHKHEVRIYDGVDRILEVLDNNNQKATFFCLGWLAEYHPDIIRKIHVMGHQIGCHSYQHELASRFNKKEFLEDTGKARKLIEHVIGEKVTLFRAPAFSITNQNLYALEALIELGFDTDCSIFTAPRDFGGMPDRQLYEPAYVSYKGLKIKEFPMSLYRFLGRSIVFSGGGYFRLFPYPVIKYLTNQSDYVMTYFHPSDFDPDQPQMDHLPPLRKWKNEVGLRYSFQKFQKYLKDIEFMNISQADQMIDWDSAKCIFL